MRIRNRDSCRGHFMKLKNITIPIYILSLSILVIHNNNYVKLNSVIYSINTRTKHNLYQPQSSKKENITLELQCSIVYQHK